jgi:hypothetical protein
LDSAKVLTFTPNGKAFRGRAKQYYWGIGLSQATEDKAERMSSGGRLTYRYTFDWPYANVEIGEENSVPFREVTHA